jgi:soluble lytic murein transglycosylase-like protein
MDDAVVRIMNSYEKVASVDHQRREEYRAKIKSYLATLSSAGLRDPVQLIEYGAAYLRGLHEGPDSGYTGC